MRSAAAVAARSTSSGPDAGTSAIGWPSAGLATLAVSPLALSTQLPPMNCW